MNTPLPASLISQATAALSAVTGLSVTFLTDRQLRIGTRTFPTSGQLLGLTSTDAILITPCLPPAQALTLRQQGRHYLDAAGNASVQTPDFYLLVEGQTPAPPATPITPAPVGLRLLYYLLSDPELLQAPYREISQRVGVALGSVSAFFTELRQQGLLREEATCRVVDTEILLARWLEDYSQILRPTLGARRYRWTTAPGTRWRQLPMVTGAYWGGEPAARLLLQEKHSSPKSFTLYSDCLPDWGLVPDSVAGSVEVLAPPFPLPQLAGTGGIAHPLLVYTDLLLSGQASAQHIAYQLQARYLPHLA